MIRLLTSLTIALALLASTAPAHAEEADENQNRGGSFWELVVAGGMLLPLGAMADEHQQSLAGSVRVGWVSRIGLGVDLALDYSPLSRRQTVPDEVYEVHFATAGLMPRFTLGKNTVRLWLAAGGGMAFEHAEQVRSDGGAGTDPAVNRLAAASMGAAGLELHPFSGVGLAVTGSYTRTYGALDHQLLNVTGGLAITFR